MGAVKKLIGSVSIWRGLVGSHICLIDSGRTSWDLVGSGWEDLGGDLGEDLDEDLGGSGWI